MSSEHDPIFVNNSLTTGIYSDPDENSQNQLSRFTFSSDDTILYNPEMYYISLARFKIHTESIPMYIFPVAQYPNTNPDLSPFVITFQYKTDVGVQLLVLSDSVIYESQYIGYTPPDITVANVNLVDYNNLLYYSVYDVVQLIKIFNDNIKRMWINFCDALVLLGVVLDKAKYPYYEYDFSLKRFKLVLEAAYFDQTAGETTNVFMYQDLLSADLFGCPYSYLTKPLRPAPDALCKMSCYDTKNNIDSGLITMTATQNTFNIMCPVSRIVFLIDVSTKLEYDIQQTNQQNVAIDNNQYIARPQLPIFFDVQVDADAFGENRNIIQYTTSSIAQNRLVSLKSGPPIKNFTIQAYWCDIFNNKHAIIAQGNSNNLIKVAFYSKTTMLL